MLTVQSEQDIIMERFKANLSHTDKATMNVYMEFLLSDETSWENFVEKVKRALDDTCNI